MGERVGGPPPRDDGEWVSSDECSVEEIQRAQRLAHVGMWYVEPGDGLQPGWVFRPYRNDPVVLRETARAVVAYWDSLDAVPADDPRATESFAAEMDDRINALRGLLGGGR